MDVDKYRKRIQSEVTCCVCLSYFTRPVELGCGHNFCKTCILRCWEESGERTRCPECRTVVENDFKQNRLLADLVGIVSEWDYVAERDAQRRRSKCQRHQKTLDLFCRDNEAPFCGECDTSQGHSGHRVVPVEEAFQDYKDQPYRCLETLKEEEAEKLASNRTEKNSHRLLEQLMSDRQKMKGEFRQLHSFLDGQEYQLLKQLEEVENEIERKLMQDHGSTSQRHEERSTFGSTNNIPYGLMCKFWNFGHINTFLASSFQQFKGTIRSGLSVRKGFYIRR
ncbi:E3 ubiquitin-protein ligase TRIM17-like [Podarcis raffonei]|uniref:E3 ubiquitin-protein ligase TRIM17-like n=1 Tax=Podarcis raffonei TaxID=65483 RepID=UPI0023296342|nr:E3 ubiquitin-protein ligase TRIM17-like [Podarcis raffonei]